MNNQAIWLRAIRVLFSGLSAVLPLVAFTLVSADAESFRDETPRIAIVSAFAPELKILKGGLSHKSDHTVNGVEFTTGTLEGQTVVLFLSGIGIVNAAMNTQLALNRFAIRQIVFSGIAGGVDPSLNIGDVVIAERWGQYLEMLFAREVGGGWEKVPFFDYPYGNFGMMFPRSVTILRAGLDKPETRFWFPVDESLMAAARRAADKVTLKGCMEDGTCLESSPQVTVGGSGVSGSAFVDNAAFRIWVFETFDARVLDMESAAMAHVAYSNDVPFIAVRSLADLAGGGEGANQMNIFLGIAAANAATLVRELLREVPDIY
ncbi:MAG: 5'-methylthioadenosine/S-adenosylhomocysteine nucleosidase [Rhodobacteraceae bacterium]|nr:5'-methylthioadenosine/S-adenosylhomocysteine nucleosidase [Paracoccaceae bacterium]